MFPSHSAIRPTIHRPPPSRNARAPVLLSSGRSAETSQPGQAGPQLRSSRITLHRHVCLHMLILWLDIVCQARSKGSGRAANQAGPGGPIVSSCICMVSAARLGSLSS